MKSIFQTRRFKKDFKKLKKRGKDIEKLKGVMRALAAGEPLEERHRDHPLIGNGSGFRDCHVEPGWIVIYRVEDGFLYLEQTGSHSDLFR